MVQKIVMKANTINNIAFLHRSIFPATEPPFPELGGKNFKAREIHRFRGKSLKPYHYISLHGYTENPFLYICAKNIVVVCQWFTQYVFDESPL